MKAIAPADHRRWPASISIALSLYALLGGAVSFSGWPLDIRRFTDWYNVGISIQPNAALCVIFAGLSLVLLSAHRRHLAGFCGAIVLLIGGLTLGQWLSGVSFGIDSWLLFDRDWGRGGVVFPGRMGPPGSLSWTLIGTALMLSAWGQRARRLAPALGITTAAVSGLSLIGYWYGVDQLYSLPYFTVIAAQTSSFVMALSLGIVVGNPGLEPMRTLFDPGSAGLLARRILPALLIFPVVLGYFSVKAQEWGSFDTGLGTAVLVLSLIGLLAALLWWPLSAVRAHDQRERESSRRFTATLESISDGFFSVDAAWRFIYVNGEFERACDLRREDVLGRTFQEIFPQVVNTPVFAALRRCMEQKVYVELENYYEVWGRWFFIRNYPLPEGGFAQYFVDITERKKAEQALEETRRAEQERRLELETFLRAAPAAIWVAHDRECRVITGNPAAAAMLRAPLDANVSQTGASATETPARPQIYINGRLVSALELPMQTAARTGRPVPDQELEFRFPDGSSHWAYGNAVPLLDTQHAVRGAIGTFVDATSLKEAQKSLREADRRKDEFLATLAHELRNPLAPIRNAATILRSEGLSARELQWARDVIDRQVQQMARLIDDLLDLNRIRLGKIELKRERVGLVKIVHGAVEASRPLIEERGQEMTVALPTQAIFLHGDSTRLTQVLCNLLNNAAKYSPHGGRIVLSAERHGDSAVIRIRDNGVGIPPAMLSKVFDMFLQINRSVENAQGGLGIGLTLVKQVIEMHGGGVEAHSAGVGQGSEFVVRLPVFEHQQPAANSTGRPAPPPSAHRVLIVDDNRDAADSLEMMLRIRGNHVRTAYDGVEAVRVADEFHPDVVLLDLGLPKMNGYDTARALRGTLGGEKVALIAVTGWGQEEDRRRSKDAGFDHHLVKPVGPEALLRLLASLPMRSDSNIARTE